MPTGFETLAQAAVAALTAAGITATRQQADDAWRPEDCPRVVVRRGPTQRDPSSPLGREYHEIQLSVHCLVAAADWETAADALHAAAHAALLASPALTGRAIELRGTTPAADSGADTVGELIAVYALQPVLDETLNLL